MNHKAGPFEDALQHTVFDKIFPLEPLAICRPPQTKPKSFPVNKEGTGSGGNLDLCEKPLCAGLQGLETS